jgi:hypothetical protein
MTPAACGPLGRITRLAMLAGALVVGTAGAPAAWAWEPREASPVLDPSIIQPDAQLRLREDGSAVYLARGTGSEVNRLVVRPPGGPAGFASPFAGGFGQYASTNLLMLSPLDSAGSLVVVRQASPLGVAWLGAAADPAAVTVEPYADRISHVDIAPSGEAAAIVGGGSTASVSFRAAGPGGRFDTPRSLNRAGNMRSYGIGITIDPDGGIFVVYRTEQARAVLQTYAPPGGDFVAPELVDIPAATMASAGWEPVFAQSTNGRGMLVWSESTGGDNNPEQVWAATRAPGGLLGPKSLVAEVPTGNRGISENAAGITDDGSQYIAYQDYVPVSGCEGNRDTHSGSVLATRSGGDWSRVPEPGTWPNNSQVSRGGIVTAGNRVGVIIRQSVDTGTRCQDTSGGASSLTVRLGEGGALGAPTTIVSESDNGSVGTDGFAVNAAGRAIVLSDERLNDGSYKRFLYVHEGGVGPGEPPPVDPPPVDLPSQEAPSGNPPAVAAPSGGSTKPLPAPGKVVLTGNKLVARGGDVPFEASCVRLGPGDKTYCSIVAILLEQTKRDAAKGKSSAVTTAKSKKAPKPKLLGSARQVRIAAGKTGTVKLKLNAAGLKTLAKSKGKLSVTLRVTIRKAGAETVTVDRKVTLKPGKSKKKR